MRFLGTCEITLNPICEVRVHFSIFFTLPWDLSGGLVIGATQLQWVTFCIAMHTNIPLGHSLCLVHALFLTP